MYMYARRTNTIGMLCMVFASLCFAASNQTTTTPQTDQIQSGQPQTDQQQIKNLQQQLYTELSAGNIQSATYEENSEVKIANLQMQLASKYLALGNRQTAAIYALSARKNLQNVYGNANDPRLIPVYSLLVDIYETDVDSDYPGTDVSDAAQAKLYRNLIDHIHAE